MAVPARALCSQKMTVQWRKVTIMPPMNGPSAGPMSVPLRNQPRAVARSVCFNISRVRYSVDDYLLQLAEASSVTCVEMVVRVISDAKPSVEWISGARR